MQIVKKQKYRLYWKHNNRINRGAKVLTKKQAKAWVEEMKKKYPHIYHYYGE